jgi:hypothetical protein
MSARGQGWGRIGDAPNANQFQTEFVNPADQAMEAGAIGHRAPRIVTPGRVDSVPSLNACARFSFAPPSMVSS